MKYQRALLVLVPLLLLACEDENTVTPPPPPSLSAEEQQVVDNCRAIRDALEAYAAGHGGSYGDNGWIPDLGLDEMTNPYSGEREPSGAWPLSPGQIGMEGYACDGVVLGYRITGYGRDGVVITLESLGNVPSDIRDDHDATIANALLVMDAAKRYAAANDGEFPSDVNASTNNDGNTLVDLLPDGALLLNPITDQQDNPVDGSTFGDGSIGYTPRDVAGEGIQSSFLIDASGCGFDIILTLVPRTEFEERVNADARTLRAAVEMFADASGEYPRNLDNDWTPGGKRVLDLYSEIASNHRTDFINPYTKLHYIPSIGIATGKGNIAYQPIETEGVVTDYVITGRSVFDEIVRIGPYPTP